MPQDVMAYWTQLDQLRERVLAGDRDGAARLLDDLGRAAPVRASGQTADDFVALNRRRHEVLAQMAAVLGLDVPAPPEAAAAPLPVEAAEELPGFSPGGRPGVSLVTCCRNREANLLRAMGSWLKCRDVSEIIVVDWTSDWPVRDALRNAGIDDPRIRVIRVEDEPRWILTCAFNAGFRVATGDRILKLDADIVLDPEFMAVNRLQPGQFLAGNWRTAGQDQVHVNGSFYLWRADLAAVGGFNEHITTYGWDDDDLYGRLEQQGLTRCDVDPRSLHHLPHSDAERLGPGAGRDAAAGAVVAPPAGATGGGWVGADGAAEGITEGTAEGTAQDPRRTGLAELLDDPMHKIRRNRLLTYIMPGWGARSVPLPLEILGGALADPGDMVLRRSGRVPHPVPEHVAADADYYAMLEMTAWRLGQRVRGLDRRRLALLLNTPFADLGPADVEVALGPRPADTGAPGGYLVIRVMSETVPQDDRPAGRAFDILCARARARGLTPVLSGSFHQLPDTASARALACSFVPEWEKIGRPELIGLAMLTTAPLARRPGQHFRITLDAGLILALLGDADVAETPFTEPDSIPDLAAPTLISARPRLFVDAQHGLGNRLRAIGSAASIAEKSGHELVVVWQPDHHCDCRFGDLFEYDGAVIGESFADAAAGRGWAVYNYMETEPGAAKNAEIRTGTGDLYLRSAYVFNCTLSREDDENRFLQMLRPVDAVRDMLAGVRRPNDLSVHVRMASGKGYEHLSYEAAENWTAEGQDQIAYWRAKSHFSRFITRIETLRGEGRAGRIFLAADKPETYDAFRDRFGARVAMLERDIWDRSADQMRYALADALLLGSAPHLLGSSWSSFSELALRLAPQPVTFETSGRDF